jgi:hypothetical protein
VAFGAVVSLTAVLLVFQYGQPWIFMAMARDGLLPQWASRIHPKYRTPHITTVVTGVVVALGGLVADENEIYDLTNIGTLSAFAIVCVGVLVLRYKDPDRPRPFKVPFAGVSHRDGRGRLPLGNGRASGSGMGSLLVAGDRAVALFPLQLLSKPPSERLLTDMREWYNQPFGLSPKLLV